jgi:hypothetical protein
VLVKRFRVPARNQELILTAFEEPRWPSVIDDPLPRSEHVDSPPRLSFTIRRLNGRQKRKIVHFFGTGTGAAIGWGCIALGRVVRASAIR